MPEYPCTHIMLSHEDQLLLMDIAKAQRMTIMDGIALGVGFMIAPVVLAISAFFFLMMLRAIS